MLPSQGGTLAADLPHARCACPLTPFVPSIAKRTVRGNDAFCEKCWCFVCEVPAAQCHQWTSMDTKQPAHCNGHARGKMWATLKNDARNKADR